MTATNEDIRRAFNVQKMRLIGVASGYIDGNKVGPPEITPKMQKRIPFSKDYNTYEEYMNDKMLVIEMMGKNEEIPNDIFNKLKSTAEELDLLW